MVDGARPDFWSRYAEDFHSITRMTNDQLPRGAINVPKVILVGGPSHSGKSTTAKLIASRMGYEYCACDKLARHPGRPWAIGGKDIPEHVRQHYRDLSPPELMHEVYNHYQKNVRPLVDNIISGRLAEDKAEGLVLEGSALLPGLLTHRLTDPRVFAIWIALDNDEIRKRIVKESNYDHQVPDVKFLIDKFCVRNKLLAALISSEVDRYSCQSISVLSHEDPPQVGTRILAGFGFGFGDIQR